MSIEMDNPVTLVEKLDTAANHLAQMGLSLMMNDYHGVKSLLAEATDLLFQAIQQADELGV